jgi:hypothetical protein
MTHRIRLRAPVPRYERNNDAAFYLFIAFLLLAVVGLAWWFGLLRLLWLAAGIAALGWLTREAARMMR